MGKKRKNLVEAEIVPQDNSITNHQDKKEKKKKKKDGSTCKEEVEEPVEVIVENIVEEIAETINDNDSCQLSSESDIEIEDSEIVLKRMRKIKKRKIPVWDVENVRYPVQIEENISDSLISDAPLHKLFPKICNISADEVEQIKINKINWTKGKFSEQENRILKDNWEKYLMDNNVPNAALLFGMFRHGKELDSSLKEYYQIFAKSSKLILRLANGLPNRRLQQIYQRARILFVGLKKGSDFTEEDQKLILKLHKTHGEKYAMFCEKYGFNPKAAREFIRNNTNIAGISYKRGPWSEDEVEKLRFFVKEYMKENNSKSFENISWAWISSRMNRSDIQCRNKFFSKAVYQLMTVESKTKWDEKLDFAKFISLIRKMDFKDEFDIDWDFINHTFGVQLFNVLHSTWRVNKFNVPDSDKKSLYEIIEYIYLRKVQKLYGHLPKKMKIINDFVENALNKLN